MTRYCALHQIQDAQQIKDFDLDGYAFCSQESDQSSWVLSANLPDRWLANENSPCLENRKGCMIA